MASRDIDIEQLHLYLRATVRRGARAPRILRYVPGLVDLLYPATDHPHLTDHNRAEHTENAIRRAVDDIGGPDAEALATVLGLRPGTVGRTVTDRRGLAGRYLGMQGDTFRRPWNEHRLLADLAHAIGRHHGASTLQP